MINDLLDYAQTRLGSGLPLNISEGNMTMLCGDVIDEIESAFPGTSVYSKLPEICQGAWDTSRVKQMLSNLLANAVHHGTPDGPISLEVQTAEKHVTIAIHNDGVPIPLSLQATLFRPVYVDKDHRPRRQGHGSSGLGLGLYIANQIATAHGGELSLTSSVEDGTTFTITLPYSEVGAWTPGVSLQR